MILWLCVKLSRINLDSIIIDDILLTNFAFLASNPQVLTLNTTRSFSMHAEIITKKNKKTKTKLNINNYI